MVSMLVKLLNELLCQLRHKMTFCFSFSFAKYPILWNLYEAVNLYLAVTKSPPWVTA